MADSDFSALAEVVPQASYEIVGRVIPGIVLILSLVVVIKGPDPTALYLDEAVIHSKDGPSGWAMVLLVIAAYVLAFVLDGVWQIATCVRRRKGCQPDLDARGTSLKFDCVNQKLPKAGAWLTKLYAETNAAQVLIVGWVIGAAINIYYLVTAFSVERTWLEVGLIAGTIGAAAVRNSVAATRENSLENLWGLLQEWTFTEQTENTSGEESDS
jgi:hypothetical protein